MVTPRPRLPFTSCLSFPRSFLSSFSLASLRMSRCDFSYIKLIHTPASTLPYSPFLARPIPPTSPPSSYLALLAVSQGKKTILLPLLARCQSTRARRRRCNRATPAQRIGLRDRIRRKRTRKNWTTVVATTPTAVVIVTGNEG